MVMQRQTQRVAMQQHFLISFIADIGSKSWSSCLFLSKQKRVPLLLQFELHPSLLTLDGRVSCSALTCTRQPFTRVLTNNLNQRQGNSIAYLQSTEAVKTYFSISRLYLQLLCRMAHWCTLHRPHNPISANVTPHTKLWDIYTDQRIWTKDCA